jgi:hypothetical protein
VAGAIIMVGALTRTTSLVALGVFTGAVTVLADWLKLGHEPGFGARQICGCVLGGILTLRGLWIGRRPGSAPSA